MYGYNVMKKIFIIGYVFLTGITILLVVFFVKHPRNIYVEKEPTEIESIVIKNGNEGIIYEIEEVAVKRQIINELNNLKLLRHTKDDKAVGWSLVFNIKVSDKIQTYELLEDGISYAGYKYCNVDTFKQYKEFYKYILAFVKE